MPPNWLNQPPSLKIFILGAARSGTSAMFIALAEVLKLPGYGESHVMPAFQRMIFHLRQYTELFANVPEGVAVKRLDAGEVERLLHDYARTFYATMFTNQSFIDKTPTGEAIYGATTIEQVFPDARLVVMRRNGIEVVKSFRLKFTTAFEQACLAWREAMSGILMARQCCRRIIEVDQFDMANAPFDTARRLSAWLDRPEAAEPLGRLFGSTRVEKSSTHDWSQRLRLADMDWSADEKNTFRDTCGPMMEAFGYPM